MKAPEFDDIREAAMSALERQSSEFPEDARVTRAVIDVCIDGQTEIVSFYLRDNVLAWSCTSGDDEGPYAMSALQVLARAAPMHAPGVRTTSSGDVVSVDRLSTPGMQRADAQPSVTLQDALDDLLVAIVRVGAREAAGSPSVQENLERVTSCVPTPTPLGLARWVGLLRAALGTGDIDLVARLLDGATRVAADLRHKAPDEQACRRMVSWLGVPAGRQGLASRVSDRTLMELARVYVAGQDRGAIERRYLVCLQTGVIFREERARGAAGASVGPCPRLVAVGLGEIEEGIDPRRMRLLQYAVSNRIDAECWGRLDSVAARLFEPAAAAYRDHTAANPGLAEPFVLLAPAAIEWEPAALLDAEGAPMPLAVAREPSLAAAMHNFLGDRVPAWVAGRLLHADRTLMLVPYMVGVGSPAERAVLRIA